MVKLQEVLRNRNITKTANKNVAEFIAKILSFPHKPTKKEYMLLSRLRNRFPDKKMGLRDKIKAIITTQGRLRAREAKIGDKLYRSTFMKDSKSKIRNHYKHYSKIRKLTREADLERALSSAEGFKSSFD